MKKNFLNGMLKNKYIIYIFVIMYLSTILIYVPLNGNVSAESSTIENYDLYADLDTSVDNGWLSTEGGSGVTSTYHRSGLKSYECVAISKNLRFNITASTMSNFSYYALCISGAPAINHGAMFIAASNNTILTSQYVYTNNYDSSKSTLTYEYYDVYLGMIVFAIVPNSDVYWHRVVIEENGTYLLKFSVYNGSVLLGYHDFGMIYPWNDFRQFVVSSHLATPNAYPGLVFDDIVADGIGFSNPTGCDLTSYSSKGDLSYFAYDKSSLNKEYVHQLYRVPITGIITGVELMISGDMYDWAMYANQPSYFKLYINGLSIGSAYEIYAKGSNYVVKWCGFNVNVTDSTVAFDFLQNTVSSPYFGYWMVGVASTSNDVDDDGVVEHTWSRTTGYGGDVKFNDLAYKFYYSSITINPIVSPYTKDGITVPKSSYFVGDNIPIFYNISTFLYTNTIQLWHNGTQLTDEIFPYNVPVNMYDDLNNPICYVPKNIGQYQFRLYRNSIKICTSPNITVSMPANSNYIISAYPNPYPYNTRFSIFYRYYNPTGYNGLLMIGTTSMMTSTNDSLKYYYITSNTSDTIIYPGEGYGGTNNYYAMLFFSSDGSSYYFADEVYIELLPTGITLNVLPGNGKLNKDGVINETISGQHSYKGWDVYVMLNEENLGNVGNNYMYSVKKELTIAQTYEAILLLSTMNGTIELKSSIFSITPYDGIIETQSYWDALFSDYKYVFAFGIVIMFLFLPMTIASRLGMELPMIVNLGTGALALAFCISVGLLEMWVAFLVTVTMVVGALIVIFTR